MKRPWGVLTLALLLLLALLAPAHAQRLVGVTLSSGTVAATGDVATFDVGVNADIGLQVSGSAFVGTILYEGTVDKTNWIGFGGSVGATSGNVIRVFPVSGLQQIRLRVTAVTTAGTVSYTLFGSPVSSSIGGLTMSASPQTTSLATNIRAAPARLYAVTMNNPHSATCYLQIINKASPTLGTDAPLLSLVLVNAGATTITFPYGVDFTTALAAGSTTTATGATGCGGAGGAAGMVYNLIFK